jgi:hypothetical protein
MTHEKATILISDDFVPGCHLRTLPSHILFEQGVLVVRIKKFIAGGLLGLSIATAAVAQDAATNAKAKAVQPVAFEYDNYLGDNTDEGNGAQNASEASTSADAEGYIESSSGRWCHRGELGQPWTLPQPGFLAENQIVISGWVDAGIYGNQYGAASNGPLGFENLGDGATVNQVWMSIDRKADNKGCGWAWGGHMDYLFGTDAPDTSAFGDRSWDYEWTTSRDYGSAMPQLYGEVAYDNLSVKIGRFYTTIGYEVVPATQNFFYSHSYSMYYAEPFTHTGALATYKCNDKLSVCGGWVNGWDEGWATKNNGSMFLGGVTLTLSEKASLIWMLTAGKIGDGTAYAGAANGDVYMNSIVFNYKFNDKWNYIFQSDLGTNYNNGTSYYSSASDNQWYSLNNYLIRKLNDRWSAGARLEWFQDPQGARTGYQGNYYELTGGVNYKPNANLTIRPELRYDSFDSIGAASHPFNDNTKDTQLSGGLDVIFTF